MEKLCVLQEAAESDSGRITITAPPPSNLDDISRINTPSSLASGPPRGPPPLPPPPPPPPLLPPREGLARPAVPEAEPSEAEESSREPEAGADHYQPILNDMKTQISDNQSNDQLNQLDSWVRSGNGVVGGLPPQIDDDQFSCVSGIPEYTAPSREGRVAYLPSPASAEEPAVRNWDEYVNSGEENVNFENREPHGEPPAIEDTELEEEENMNARSEVPSNATFKALQPADQEDTVNHVGATDPLDNFDVTEEELENELKEEIDKLHLWLLACVQRAFDGDSWHSSTIQSVIKSFGESQRSAKKRVLLFLNTFQVGCIWLSLQCAVTQFLAQSRISRFRRQMSFLSRNFLDQCFTFSRVQALRLGVPERKRTETFLWCTNFLNSLCAKFGGHLWLPCSCVFCHWHWTAC